MITLLTGTNSYAISRTVADMAAGFDGDVEKIDAGELTTDRLPDLFMGATLFAPQRLIVLRGVAGQKSLWSDLEQWIERVPDETDIVMVDENPDKRTKTYKLLQKHATIRDHAELNEADLVAWLEGELRHHELELPRDVVRYLVSYVGHDQWRLRSELDKLLLADKPITRELIQDVAEPYPEASAFELLDATFAGNEARVRELIELLSEREDPYQFFGLLSSQVMALMALVSAGSRTPDAIAKDMGLHPFVIRKLSGVARTLGRRNVNRLVDRLASSDVRIKTTGAQPWQQIELTLLSSLAH